MPWITRPGRCFSGRMRQISLTPVSYTCGRGPSSSKRSMSCSASVPRTPSPSTVTFARMSMPGWKFGFGLPCLSMPMSPIRTPTTRRPSISSLSAAKPA